MLKFFCFIFFISFSANAAELINVLPEVTESQTLYSTYKRMSSIVPFIPQLNEIILKQKNANILITRGFPMPFKVSDINAANQELLNAEQSKMTPKAIKTLFSRFIQCYPDKKLCMKNIPDDLSKYLTLSEAEKNTLPAAQKRVPLLPVPPLPENANIRDKKIFYNRLLLNRLKEKANKALDKKDWRSDNSVSHQTLTAGDVLRRRNETYQNLLPAVNVNNAENIVKTEIAIKEVLSTLPMDINRSALCLSFREDKPFKVLQNKISYIAPDSKEYMFKINTEAGTDDDPYYFIFINGTEQNDDRLSERFLPPYSFPAGFFEYKKRIFLTFSDGEEEQKIYEFDPAVYAFLPVCMLNKDMTVFHIDATKENMPLCRRIVRKEYNVYPEKPLSLELNATQLQAFFKLQCPPENITCVTEKMYNFLDNAGVFADYDNNGKKDILYYSDGYSLLAVYSPEQQTSAVLIKTPDEERQQIVQIDNQNYLLTTKEYKLNNPKKPFDEEYSWQSIPKDLYKIANGNKPERICSFIANGEYY